MNKKYIVKLSTEERIQLQDLIKKGKTQAYRIKHANILLAVDVDGTNWNMSNIQFLLHVNCNSLKSGQK